jgi:hypothetical protein
LPKLRLNRAVRCLETGKRCREDRLARRPKATNAPRSLARFPNGAPAEGCTYRATSAVGVGAVKSVGAEFFIELKMDSIADEREVSEGLREVSKKGASCRVYLLGEEANIVCLRNKALELAA